MEMILELLTTIWTWIYEATRPIHPALQWIADFYVRNSAPDDSNIVIFIVDIAVKFLYKVTIIPWLMLWWYEYQPIKEQKRLYRKDKKKIVRDCKEKGKTKEEIKKALEPRLTELKAFKEEHKPFTLFLELGVKYKIVRYVIPEIVMALIKLF